MNEELYAGNAPFGALEINTRKILSRVGQVVSVRLVTDPHTGQPKWLAFKETALRWDADQAFVAQHLKLLIKGMLELVKRHSVSLRRTVLMTLALLVLGGSFCKAPVRQIQSIAVKAESDIAVKAESDIAVKAESDIDMEIRRIMEKGINLEKRRRQVPAIVAAFARRTDPQRARNLAALCYLKTLGTPFMPLDIAVIALAETGEFGLSGKAVSPKGALGVWQVMPHRAESHGYTPGEMKNDEKCAEAAVRELTGKLKMAKGNIVKAKKLYCGRGPAADAYEAKIKQLKREILDHLARIESKRVAIKAGGTRGSLAKN